MQAQLLPLTLNYLPPVGGASAPLPSAKHMQRGSGHLYLDGRQTCHIWGIWGRFSSPPQGSQFFLHVAVHKVKAEVGKVCCPPPDTPPPGTRVVPDFLVRILDISDPPRGGGGVIPLSHAMLNMRVRQQKPFLNLQSALRYCTRILCRFQWVGPNPIAHLSYSASDILPGIWHGLHAMLNVFCVFIRRPILPKRSFRKSKALCILSVWVDATILSSA